jgi:hypothetical protein
MYMSDWVVRLDDFLSLNEENILTHAGSISHELALAHGAAGGQAGGGEEINRRKLNWL